MYDLSEDLLDECCTYTAMLILGKNTYSLQIPLGDSGVLTQRVGFEF